MFNGNNCMSVPVVTSLNGCGNDGGYGWGDGAWFIWIILIFAIWGNGWGGFGGNGAGNGALTRGELCQDMNFNDLQSGIRSIQSALTDGFRNIDNAICTLGYQNAQLINGVQMQIGNEFRGLDNAICTLGYNTQAGFNGVERSLGDVNYNISNQANGISREVERGFCQTNYNMSQQNCQTLQAIDKVGDRVIDYLANQEAQKLRDENFALKLHALQADQNNYLVNQLRPCPIPSYQTCNPWASSYNCGFNGCSGCNCG